MHPIIEPAVVDDGIFGISGREDDQQVWANQLRILCQFSSLYLAGHHDVGEQQIDTIVAFHDFQRGRAVGRFDGVITQILQHQDHRGPNVVIILDHQDTLAGPADASEATAAGPTSCFVERGR